MRIQRLAVVNLVLMEIGIRLAERILAERLATRLLATLPGHRGLAGQSSAAFC